MTYRYSGRQEYLSGPVTEKQSSVRKLQTRSRLRVLIPGKAEGTDNLCDILAANVQRWGYEAVIVTAPMMQDRQARRNVEGDILLYDMDALLQHSDVPSGAGGELAAMPPGDLAAFKLDWPTARLNVLLSSSSISRQTLDRLDAIALLHKPFDLRILERYLRVFQRLLYSEVRLDDMDGAARLAHASQSNGSQEESGKAPRVMRILVADDQADVTWGIRQCLIEQENQRYLYEIREVHEGLALLEQCIVWQPHCVVTDILMPWLNGYQVMRCLASVAELPQPAFVIISALRQREIPLNPSYFQDRMIRYVDKPFDVEDLLHAIEQGLAR